MNSREIEKISLFDKTQYLPWLLIAVGVVVYANSLSGPFIYDDLHFIVENVDIRQLWPPIWASPTSMMHAPVNGRPIISFSLALNYAIGGLDVRGYHLVNIAVHILCALVLFGIVRRTLVGAKSMPHFFAQIASGLALTCALMWMVHPLQAESVNYISQRSESIMGLFYLLTLYCTIRAIGSDHYRWYGIAVVSCALGMASKEVMATAPLVVLLYERIFQFSSLRQVLCRHWGLYASLAATWSILAVLMWTRPHGNMAGFSHGISVWGYALNQCLVIADYLRLALWPHPLLLDYGYPIVPLSIHEVLPYAAGLVVLLILTLAALSYRPLLGFLGAWFFIILGPTSSFVPNISAVGAERRMYLPLAGLIVLVVLMGYMALQQMTKRVGIIEKTTTGRATDRLTNWIGGTLAVGIAGLLSYGTVLRNCDYRSDLLIWQTAVDVRPFNPRAHANFAHALESQGRLEEAEDRYRQALKVNPNYAEAHNNLASMLMSRGRLEEAIAHYRQALQINPNFIEVYYNLGNAFKSQGFLEEAIAHYRQALQINPNFVEVHNNIGVVLESQGFLEEAIAHYRQALQINPNSVEVRNNLDIALKLQRK